MALENKKFSFVYKNIYIYRFIMNILYLGNYNRRFKLITGLLKPGSDKIIVELCFGDIMIADWCKLNEIEWIGFDINKNFIKNAQFKNHNAQYKDILKFEKLPKSDVVIIMGSLYHFYAELDELINCIMCSTKRFIISEPITNLTTKTGIVGNLAKRLSKSGNGNETFRYDYDLLHDALRVVCKDKFLVSEIKRTQKDLILEIHQA